MEEEHDKIRTRRKKSSVGIVCCFTGSNHHHRRRASFDATSLSSPNASPRRSPSAWFKSKTNDFPEIKGKCRSFISRMARHRRHSSADFSYDPLSYSRNFDDDATSSVAEEDFRALSFSARLPVSPQRRMSGNSPPALPTTPEEGDDFEVNVKATSPLGEKRRSNTTTTTTKHSEGEDVRKSVDKISSNREILVQLC